ncbi:unnamed protein product [Cuscuta epithymum]|uniref:Uncharacterized protein n=1 Tax=Cuscuta epithymum TaxID=186058 RepID=A0AAV0DWP3_9ASTE|nr:unnamed protein product [Cuscuta epithymum]
MHLRAPPLSSHLPLYFTHSNTNKCFTFIYSPTKPFNQTRAKTKASQCFWRTYAEASDNDLPIATFFFEMSPNYFKTIETEGWKLAQSYQRVKERMREIELT